MSLAAGTRLGPHEIFAYIGAGCKDTLLEYDVTGDKTRFLLDTAGGNSVSLHN
jgi:hypothetical protein